MKSEDQILRLVERFDKNKACSLFNQFHEKFESKNSSQIIITTKEGAVQYVYRLTPTD